MEYIIFALIGITAGTFGGLLGIGGSVIIIPALILISSIKGDYNGSYQHLIQAVSMICNFCISLPAAIGHWRSGAVLKDVVSSLIPSALVGVLLGVSLSNTALFAGDNGKYLSLILSFFLFYIALFNLKKIINHIRKKKNDSPMPDTISRPRSIFSGGLVGIFAGLLGVGGGATCVPCQQILLKIPLRNAIANSSSTIVSIVLIGAIYKNMSLAKHGYNYIDSVKIAICIVPTAIVASYFGSKITHKINPIILRIIFTIFMLIISISLFYRSINL